MKKIMRSLGLMLALLTLTVVVSACGSRPLSQRNVLKTDQQAKTITWGVKADTRLFGLLDTKDGQIKGFEIDLAKAITKQMLGKDAKAKFIQVTSSTRMPMLKNGNIDAIIATMTNTPERRKQVAFSNTYFYAGQSLLVKKGSSIKNVKDLNRQKGTVLGVVGSDSVENVAKVAPNAKVLQLTDYAQAMTALKSGQGQALTTDNGILYGMSVQNPDYVVTGGTFVSEPYGIAVDKAQTPFRQAVNQSLKELRDNGQYQKILHKWFHNVKGFDYEEAARE
ncbi:transporter substrate-binding domain-containing protein [Levilactobacillus namurensis]|uniref:transporter substrate-binding domain-containing protein n=1 Tax=Levilactobacillus namurensis TaxID=380393 RepID=UPI00222E740D|nr:transporter substrate-binding domain-containing protein [Levilactobacillus namurensis]MCW3777695.1 transporter substrate-binding domain-containing protein [Levilactobacillus namurensis]MDT7019142.1 transporter substrate-binding domain-containing protein [Levilactobacillus namurensis]WNN66252.1 transporter substrate-binding domain-containing protein [Levilactobacillus namurensis]